ncbi:MAG TPA: N-acetylmuramoyl-L-alanine amidase [Solirubrobacterales bacterium]
MKLALIAFLAAGLMHPAPPPPPIDVWPIPYGAERKHEMAAYSERHYGQRTWRLRHPRVIVEHMARAGSVAAIRNTFADDRPDPELHELPNVCAHFVVADSGRIFRLVNLRTRCRHTVGLNWTAIGIEHVGYGDRDVLGDRRQLRASLRLPLAALPLPHSPARHDRPRREPRLSVSPREGAEPAAPDARRLAPLLDAGLPTGAEAPRPLPGQLDCGPMSEDAIEHGFREGDKVWVQDADGNRHPGVFVGDNEASGWFGGGPSAYVAHPEAHQAEVVSIFRITPRDE